MALGHPVAGGTVVMDASIATEANLVWLKQHGYEYLVVSRKQTRQFDPALATEVQTAGEDTIQVQRVQGQTTGEVLLYCYPRHGPQKIRPSTRKRRPALKPHCNRWLPV